MIDSSKKIAIFAIINVIIVAALAWAMLRQHNTTTISQHISEPIRAWPLTIHSVSNDTMNIRLLVLKHSREQMADDDAELAVEAVRKAAGKGLAIKDIGNHYIDDTKNIKIVVWKYDSVEGLKEFVSEQMKLNAVEGDTLVIFTIGHGAPSGYLHNLGQRGEVMKALADAAGENQQKVLWWQLSCYAAAKLPAVDSLPEGQRELFKILASSPANVESPAFVEGKIMEEVFGSLAEKSPKIDPDQNNEITGNEFRSYIDTVKPGRGQLFYAHNYDDPVFGVSVSLANQIPIIDRNSTQGVYPNNYIPMPKK